MRFLDVVAPEFYEEASFWYVLVGSIIVLVTVICFILFIMKKKRGNIK